MTFYFMLGCWSLAADDGLGEYSAKFLNRVSRSLSIGEVIMAHDLMFG